MKKLPVSALVLVCVITVLISTLVLIRAATNAMLPSWQAVVILAISVAATAFFTAILCRNAFLRSFEVLRGTLMESSERRNRHLFIPHDSSKMYAAIAFHFEQVLAENQQLLCELRESETIYDSILNAQEELVFVVDSDGYISYRNRAFDEIFGSPSLDFDNSRSVSAEALPELMQKISSIISDHPDSQQTNYLLFKSNIRGKERSINWVITRASSAEPVKLLFVGRDETDKIEIHRKNEKLQKIAAVGRAASTIFHEINQPLSIMQLSTFLIKVALDSNNCSLAADIKDELLSNANIIDSQIRRSNQIINHLRLFHSGEKKKLVFEDVDVSSLLQEAVNTIESDIKDHHIDLEIALQHTTAAAVRGNMTLFVQVLVNILKNSIQAIANDDNNSVRRISISSRTSKNQVFILIQDSGPGIPSSELDKVTEPFYSTKVEGSGLGLALCLDILESYQGHLKLDNMAPKGLRATIKLPLNLA